MPRGRPQTKGQLDNPEVVQTLCERLAGGMSMKQACAFPDGPVYSVVYQKMATDTDFYTRIARAREMQQHAIVDSLTAMADKATPEDWQVVRLRIWARQWSAARLAPKVYGDKVEHEVNGNLNVRRVISEAPLTQEAWIEGYAERDQEAVNDAD